MQICAKQRTSTNCIPLSESIACDFRNRLHVISKLNYGSLSHSAGAGPAVGVALGKSIKTCSIELKRLMLDGCCLDKEAVTSISKALQCCPHLVTMWSACCSWLTMHTPGLPCTLPGLPHTPWLTIRTPGFSTLQIIQMTVLLTVLLLTMLPLTVPPPDYATI